MVQYEAFYDCFSELHGKQIVPNASGFKQKKKKIFE